MTTRLYLNSMKLTRKDILTNIQKYREITTEIMSDIFSSLARKENIKTRAVNIRFDVNLVEVEIYLDSDLTNVGLEEMIEAKEEIFRLFSDAKGSQVRFDIQIVPSQNSLLNLNKNFGCLLLFRDDLNKMEYADDVYAMYSANDNWLLTEYVKETFPTFTEEEIETRIQKNSELYLKLRESIFSRLNYYIPKKTRGVTFGYDGKFLKMEIFLDSLPTDKEFDMLDELEGLICDVIPSDDNYLDYVVSVLSQERSIFEKSKNFGWLYVRQDELNKFCYIKDGIHFVSQEGKVTVKNNKDVHMQPFLIDEIWERVEEEYGDHYSNYAVRHASGDHNHWAAKHFYSTYKSDALYKSNIVFHKCAPYFLFGRISKKTRGVTYGFYEGLLEVEIILDSQPTEGEIRAMSGIETDIACLFPPSRGFRINFVVSIVSQETSILDKKKNMGWAFIFRDELSQ